MSGYTKKILCSIVALLTMAGLTACGGSGGATVAASDSGTTYKGINGHARVKEDNAADLAFGAYAGGDLGSSLGWGAMAKRVDDPPPVTPYLPQITSALKVSALQLIASEAKEVKKDASSDKVLRRAANFDVPGWSGGVASYSMDIDDATGSFSGTVKFVDFTTDRYTFTGNAGITGTVDQTRQAINFFTLSFDSLKVINGYTLDLTGSISWTFDLSAPADTMSMNMVLLDEFSGKTYWYKNYVLISIYGYEFMTQNISGRYFDPDHGYVDFATDETIVIDYSYEWPRQGTITFSGSGRTSARLRFDLGSVVIEADLDGDNVPDLHDEYLLYPQEPDAAPADAGVVMTAEQSSSTDVDSTDNAATTNNSGESGNNNNTHGNGSSGPDDERSPIHGPPHMNSP